MLPANIGRYVIKSEIARGGMATVYLAFDPFVKREVAIKLLPAMLTHDPTFRARFDLEAQTVAAVEHQGIVSLYDFGEANGQPYLVMRYMPGGSLSQRLKNGPLSLAEASRIYSRLGAALDHIHSKGIIHRDLKPANILFDEFHNAYLSDFGIAHIAEANVALTGEGMIGTPAYMSPEQARGDANITRCSDIYGLGAILFEILTGRQPFEASTPMGAAIKHITDPIPRVLEFNQELPAEIQKVIDKAMAKDCSQRYQTGASMAQAIMLIASKTLKNPLNADDERTARITQAAPVRTAPSINPPSQPKPGTPPPPVYHPPANVSPLPPARNPEVPSQPRPALTPSPQPATPPVASAHPPSEPRPTPHQGPPVWLWGLLGLFGLAVACGLILLVLWLVYS